MCLQRPLGGLDHMRRTRRVSLGEPPHAVVSIHIYTTRPKSISEHTFLWCWSMNWWFRDISLMDAWSSSAERWWRLDRYSAPRSVTVSKGSQFAEHMGGGSSGPDANPDMWILKCAQPNLPAFRNAEHLAPAKKQCLHWDIRYVTRYTSCEPGNTFRIRKEDTLETWNTRIHFCSIFRRSTLSSNSSSGWLISGRLRNNVLTPDPACNMNQELTFLECQELT